MESEPTIEPNANQLGHQGPPLDELSADNGERTDSGGQKRKSKIAKVNT